MSETPEARATHTLSKFHCPIYQLYPINHHSSRERAIYGTSCLLLAFPNPTTCPLSNLGSSNLILTLPLFSNMSLKFLGSKHAFSIFQRTITCVFEGLAGFGYDWRGFYFLQNRRCVASPSAESYFLPQAWQLCTLSVVGALSFLLSLRS